MPLKIFLIEPVWCFIHVLIVKRNAFKFEKIWKDKNNNWKWVNKLSTLSNIVSWLRNYNVVEMDSVLISVMKPTRLSTVVCLSIIWNISLSIIYIHQLALIIIQLSNFSSVLIDSAGCGMTTVIADRVFISPGDGDTGGGGCQCHDSSKYWVEEEQARILSGMRKM